MKDRIIFGLLLAPAIGFIIFKQVRTPQLTPDQRHFQIVKRQADKGDSHAQFDLATFYGTGRGVAKDTNEAIRWAAKAAAQGEPRSQDIMGTHHMGKRTQEDQNEAASLFRKSAQQGFARGQYHLGRCYFDGRGVPKDERTALEWLLRAANQGDLDADYLLGTLYVRGTVVKDVVQGVEWVRKAAEGGLGAAQFSMGTAYATGTGVNRDLVQAHMWIALALEQGQGDRPALNGLIIRMTPEEIAQAERLTAAFKKSHPLPAK